MRVDIAGGGITGCAVALQLELKGHDVRLFEKEKRLGGVMSDVWYEGEIYYSGCHYFDRGTPWFETLRGLIGIEFDSFAHDYGSLTSFQGGKNIFHDFAQPVFSGKFSDFSHSGCMGSSIENRLKLYPDGIRELLIGWARNFGDLSTLHENCVNGMALSRVFFPDDVERLIHLKSTHALGDALLGLPRSVRSSNTPKPVSNLPVSGFDHFFSSFDRLLRNSGVEVCTGTAIAPVSGPNAGLSFRARGEHLDADKIVWCCNPTGLFLKAGVGRLDAPISKMFCFVSDLPHDFPVSTVYFHVFSDWSRITRLFTYKLGTPKITVEGFDKGQSECEILDEVNMLLSEIGWDCCISSGSLMHQSRYTSYTMDDLARFENFAVLAPTLGVVPGGWQHYSRNYKIEDILQQFDD